MDQLELFLGAACSAGLRDLRYRSPRGWLEWSVPGAAGERDLLQEQKGGSVQKARQRLYILRSPSAGVRGPTRQAESEQGTGDPPVGIITLLGEEEVPVPGKGRVAKWLVQEGDRVGYKQPLAWWREE